MSTANGSVAWRLVVKDLYLHRWLVVVTLASGIASLLVSGIDKADNVRTGPNLGLLLFITTVVAFGIFVPMTGILKERQDRSQLWVLSLPISPRGYAQAKVWASLIAFLVPWLLLTGIVIVAETLAGRSGGLGVFLVMMTFFLAAFCLLVALVVVTMSEAWAIAGILASNVAVTVFLTKVLTLPGIAGGSGFTPRILTVLALELALIAVALGLALTLPARKKDFV
ncbi:MAG: ABC-2 transporter permease [Acidobacteria bacterium]|nr:ABC-2 transporter permease [Acidobacteriota bacterium]